MPRKRRPKSLATERSEKDRRSLAFDSGTARAQYISKFEYRAVAAHVRGENRRNSAVQRHGR